MQIKINQIYFFFHFSLNAIQFEIHTYSHKHISLKIAWVILVQTTELGTFLKIQLLLKKMKNTTYFSKNRKRIFMILDHFQVFFFSSFKE